MQINGNEWPTKGWKSYSLLSNRSHSCTYSNMVFHSVLENSDHEYDMYFEYVKVRMRYGSFKQG